METGSAKRTREKSFQKETSSKIRNKIRAKIKEIGSSKEGLDTNFIFDILKSEKNFIGVIPQDYLTTLKILSYPINFVVNLDLSTQSGSHWIGISIMDKTVEIYDSLAMNSRYWKYFPNFLLKFLRQFSKTHRFFITPKLQSPISNMCGLYCIYFLLYRRTMTFTDCLSVFSSNLVLNDRILINAFT